MTIFSFTAHFGAKEDCRLVWYKAMLLMSHTKKSFSTKELQKQLVMKRYELVCRMVQMVRTAMSNRDAGYTMEGMLELNEGYFRAASIAIERGRGKPSGEPTISKRR